jgi:hypothetical protein
VRFCTENGEICFKNSRYYDVNDDIIRLQRKIDRLLTAMKADLSLKSTKQECFPFRTASSPPKDLSALSVTSEKNSIHADISRIIGREIDFCFGEEELEDDGAVVVAKNISLAEYWLVLERLGGDFQNSELRNGVLVFLKMVLFNFK